jgi:hypothetical protein
MRRGGGRVERERLSIPALAWSFPNDVPLRPGAIRGIWNVVEPCRFDRLYGAFWESVVQNNAKKIVEGSLQRYVAAITDAACAG